MGDRKIAGIDKEKHMSEVKSDSCCLSWTSQQCPARKHRGSTKRDTGSWPLGPVWPLGLSVAYFAAANPPQSILVATHLPAPSCKSILHARLPTATITDKLTAFSSNYYLKNMGLMFLKVQASIVVCFELCEICTSSCHSAIHFCSAVFHIWT